MANALYDIVISGEIIPGRNREEVQSALAGLFKVTPEMAAQLLQGKPRRLKSGISEEEARRYLQALNKAGVQTRMLGRDDAPVNETPSTPEPAPAAEAEAVAQEQQRVQASGEPVARDDEAAKAAVQTAQATDEVSEEAADPSAHAEDAAEEVAEEVAQDDEPLEVVAEDAAQTDEPVEEVAESDAQACESPEEVTEETAQTEELAEVAVAIEEVVDESPEPEAEVSILADPTLEPPPEPVAQGGEVLALVAEDEPSDISAMFTGETEESDEESSLSVSGLSEQEEESTEQESDEIDTDQGPQLAFARKAALVATIAIVGLLPMTYLAIIAMLGYGSWWHAVENVQWYKTADTETMKYLMMVAYGAVLAIGPIMILLLVRPLLSLFAAGPQGCRLDLDKHHQLGEFLQQVAEFTGSPVPGEVRVHGDLGVCATPRSGLLGMFTHDYMLSIGLPLFTGMQTNQLAGLVAHELSRFSHRLVMLTHLVVVKVHDSYRKVIDHHDRLDGWVETRLENGGAALRMVLWVMAAALGLGRSVLSVLLRLSGFVSRLLSRPMEFEANQAAAELVSPEVYRSGFLRIEELSAAQEKVDQEMEYMMQDGKYPDNLQPLLSRFLAELSDEEKGRAEGALMVMRAGTGDVYPAVARRIAMAMRYDGDHAYTQADPASQLLEGYDAVCRAYTFLNYQELLGPQFSSNQMVRAVEVIRQAEERDAGNEALDVYLPNLYLASRHVVPATINAARTGVAVIKSKLQELITELRVQLPVYEQVAGRVSVLAKQLADARAAEMMTRVGVDFEASTFGLPGKSQKIITQFRDECAEKYGQQEEILEKIEYLVSCRMGLTIELLRRTDTGGGKVVADLDLYKRVLTDMNRAMEEMKGFAIESFALKTLTSRLQGKQKEQADPAKVKTYVDKCTDSYRKLLTALKDTPYPFEHGEGIGTIARYLRKHAGSPEQLAKQPASFYQAFQRTEEIMANLDRRMMLLLATWAIKVEKHLGLESVRLNFNGSAEPEMKQAVGQS